MTTLNYIKGIAKDGKVWRCRATHKGKVYKRTFKTKRDAETFIVAVRNGDGDKVAHITMPQAQRIKAGASMYGITVEELVDRLGDRLAGLRKDARGAQNTRFIMDAIRRRWGQHDLSHVTVDQCVKWAGELNEQGLAGSTVAKYLDEVHRLFKSARSRSIIKTNVTSPVPQAREILHDGDEDIISQGRSNVGRRVSQDEIEELCAEIMSGRFGCAPKPALAGFIRFAVASAFRSTEICGITWGDIDWDSHTITIANQKAGKRDTKLVRVAPMTPEMEHILASMLPQDRIVHDGDPVFPRTTKGGEVSKERPFYDRTSVYQAIQKARAHTTVPHLRVHDFRHEGCSRLGERIVEGIGYLNALQIQQFSGHKTLDMVQHYVKADAATFAAQLHVGTKGKVVKGPWRKKA